MCSSDLCADIADVERARAAACRREARASGCARARATVACIHAPEGRCVEDGDRRATTVDPTSADVFWTIAEVPVSSTVWGTRILGVVVPEPSAYVLSLAGLACGAYGMLSRRKWFASSDVVRLRRRSS